MTTNKLSLKQTIYNHLFNPLDIASLAVFRMLFGIIVMYEAWRYMDLGRIVAKFTIQDFHFTYQFFEWVKPLDTFQMQWVFIAYFVAGLLITLGLFYHLATITATLCISYIFFVEATNYLNHFYLVIIMSTMMIFIPAHKGWSLYALFRKHKGRQTTPGWTVWVLRSQLAIVYFYAAIAKMNVDWINGQPLFDWIGARATATGFEQILAWPAVVYGFTYMGLLYDLVVAPMLLHRKTRAIAYCLSLSFHLTNFYLFNIGIFPWFMIAATTIFFEPDWPRNILRFLFEGRFSKPDLLLSHHQTASAMRSFLVLVIGTHLALQVIIPLRHFAFPNYASWTEDGHNFAWHMKLRGKNGKISFTVVDPETKKAEQVNPRHFLTDRQVKKMATRPTLMLQFARFLSDYYTIEGEKPAEVYAETKIRVNERQAQRLVDPTVNLAAVKEPFFSPSPWVFPVRQPVWNAANKRNRFGPSLKKDDIAYRAIHRLDGQANAVVDKR